MSASATAGGSSAGAGYETFTLTNDGPSPCSVQGYVNIAFFGASAGGGAGAGPRLTVSVQHGSGSESPLVLKMKSAAQFLALYSDVPAGGVGCETVASVQISLAGSAESLTIPASFSLCGGSVRIDPLGLPGSETP